MTEPRDDDHDPIACALIAIMARMPRIRIVHRGGLRIASPAGLVQTVLRDDDGRDAAIAELMVYADRLMADGNRVGEWLALWLAGADMTDHAGAIEHEAAITPP